MCIIIPSIIGAACFQPVFRKLDNKGRTASVFALLTGISMLSMYFFNVKESAVIFYALAGVTQFFFSGFNTAIYAIIPDCVEYGEWKTGLRNDGFQYAFVSLGNKIGMAIGTAMLAMLLGKYGYVANQTQNSAATSSILSPEEIISSMMTTSLPSTESPRNSWATIGFLPLTTVE